MRDVTLLFLLKPESREVLLAMKKRGFGAGKYNGVGGKVEPGETIESTAVREAYEEIGVRVESQLMTKAAEITFLYEEKPEWDLHCHVFLTHQWEGEPTESEEMVPRWFPIDAIPYEEMWVDDCEWLPLILAGKKLDASFRLTSDGSVIIERSIRERT